jgi:hypothetical protein
LPKALSRKMVEGYFRDLASQLPSPLLTSISQVMQPKAQMIAEKHLSQDLKEWAVGEWIAQQRTKGDLDRVLREQRLNDSIRAKAELELKLSQLKVSIDALKETPLPSEASKPNLQDKVSRHEFYEQEQRKVREAEEEARRRLIEQKQRRRRLKEQLKGLEGKIEQQQAEETEAALKEQFEKERHYKERLEEMRAKTEQRRLQREQLSKLQGQVVKSKPLYVKMQENFDTSVVMPELESRKAELLKKRERFKPISRAEIISHNDAVTRTLKERDHKKAKSALKTMTESSSKDAMKSLLHLELDVSKDEEGPEARRKRLVEKQRKYASLASELHKPVPSASKQLELQANISKLKTKPKPLSRSQADISFTKTPSVKPSKPKPKAPPSPQDQRPKYKDYIERRDSLEALRGKRDKSMVNDIRSKLSVLQSSFY